MSGSPSWRLQAARLTIGAVLVSNLSAAIPYVLSPERFASSFELSGIAGGAMVRAIGVLFLMWCAAYVPVIAHPDRNAALFGVILAQQVIGLVGEAWIAATLPAGHGALAGMGLRFMVFDGAGLALLVLAFVLARPQAR